MFRKQQPAAHSHARWTSGGTKESSSSTAKNREKLGSTHMANCSTFKLARTNIKGTRLPSLLTHSLGSSDCVHGMHALQSPQTTRRGGSTRRENKNCSSGGASVAPQAVVSAATRGGGLIQHPPRKTKQNKKQGWYGRAHIVGCRISRMLYCNEFMHDTSCAHSAAVEEEEKEQRAVRGRRPTSFSTTVPP